MINQKLLSSVLNKTVSSYSFVSEFKGLINFLSITFNDGSSIVIDIYEFSRKCKEWANEKGYYIQSYITSKKEGAAIANKYGWTSGSEFTSETSEELAVIKACEWVYLQTLI